MKRSRNRDSEKQRYGAHWRGLGLGTGNGFRGEPQGERVLAHHDPVAALLGDPPPGRSALEARRPEPARITLGKAG